ncbi:hypothetical protein G6F53_014272 [Rhizopus delemar]|nr:hypothetical protein G6F53_014272 [Rhizopus delemar]
MDLHQQRGQVGQLCEGDRTAIDPGPRAAVGADHAAQLALIFIVQLVVGQPLARGLAGARLGRVLEFEG